MDASRRAGNCAEASPHRGEGEVHTAEGAGRGGLRDFSNINGEKGCEQRAPFVQLKACTGHATAYLS